MKFDLMNSRKKLDYNRSGKLHVIFQYVWYNQMINYQESIRLLIQNIQSKNEFSTLKKKQRNKF